MTPGICPLIAGNWKMNGTGESLAELETMACAAAALKTGAGRRVDCLICLPATLLSRAANRIKGQGLSLGGEDCHFADKGAHTGDISAAMLKDAGADFVIVGHSERRTDHHETDAMVRAKAEAAWRAGLTAIVCVGETWRHRESGRTLDVIAEQCAGSVPDGAQAAHLVIAYEPVWAIGTGKTPTAEDVAEIHGFIRKKLQMRFEAQGSRIRLLYGGSVKPDNAASLLGIEHVDGALVGGASLKACDFLAICESCHKL